MIRGAKSKAVSLGLVFAVLLFCAPQVLRSQAAGRGNLIGFVYAKDGTTPVQDAVVLVRNVSTGTVFESKKSDSLGIFRFESVDAGIYAIGVTSKDGDFNSSDFVGISPNDTAKVSIALTPYENEAVAAAQQVAKEQKESGESRIGRVINFNAGAREAEVFIERGLLQVNDRIRVKTETAETSGVKTDFYQDAKVLKIGATSINKALAGQTILLGLQKPAIPGDSVYVVCKKGVPPIFLAPLGLAAVIGGIGLTTLGEEETATPFKTKK